MVPSFVVVQVVIVAVAIAAITIAIVSVFAVSRPTAAPPFHDRCSKGRRRLFLITLVVATVMPVAIIVV